MTQLDSIEDLRTVLENAFTNALTGTCEIFTRNNAGVVKKNRPRIEIVVSIGAATGHRRAFPNSQPPVTRFDRWNFTVKFECIVEPQAALTQQAGETDADFNQRQQQNNQLLAQLVAAVRAYASTAAQVSWNDLVNFPNHFIGEPLRDAGSPSTLETIKANERTSLNYAGQIGVRESAWAGVN